MQCAKNREIVCGGVGAGVCLGGVGPPCMPYVFNFTLSNIPRYIKVVEQLESMCTESWLIALVQMDDCLIELRLDWTQIRFNL